MSALLLSTLSIQAMEPGIHIGPIFFYAETHEQIIHPYQLNNQPVRLDTEQNLLESKKAEEHNENNCLLISLPPEKLIEIFSHCSVGGNNQIQSLEANIKRFMKLNTTCKHFNKLLTFKEIGAFCKNYDLKTKNETLKKLMRTINDPNYKTKRLPALALICANADANTRTDATLLNSAVIYKDTQAVAILFEHHADPNIKDCVGDPLFFRAKTIEIVRLLIAQGINIHAPGKMTSTPNVLWKAIGTSHPSEIMALYLEKAVDVITLHPLNKSCLLHKLANEDHYLKDIDDFLKKGVLLLKAMPKEMVNTLDKRGKTPLDAALASLEKAKELTHGTPKAFEQLIALFKAHGGRTAQELKKDAMILLLHKDDHVGDLSILPHDVRKCIVSYMMDLKK